MTSLPIKSYVILALLLGTIMSPAQENSTPPVLRTAQGPSRIYVVDFKDVTSKRAPADSGFLGINARDIAQLTTTLLRLRLLEIPTLEVKAADKAPICGGLGNQTQRDRSRAAQTSIQSQEMTIEPMGEQFFMIRGSVDFHPPDIAVDYSLEKCDGISRRGLASDHLTLSADRSTFGADKILEQLSILTQSLGYILRNPPTTIGVGKFQPDGEKLASDLARYLRRALTQWPGFKLSPTSENPEYLIDGSVSAQKETIHASVQFHSTHGDHASYPAVEVSGPRKNWQVLKKKLASRTSESLNDIRLARRFGGNTLSATSFDDLLKEGRHLLCQDEPPLLSCRQDPSAAVRVFQEARSRPSKMNDWNIVYYLGMAQAANYKYADAAKFLSEAISDITRSSLKGLEAKKAKIKVHNSLGDVYAKYGDVKQAVEQYEESLKINPDQAELYVKSAEALFVNDRPGAAQALLDGLRQLPDEDQLHLALLENVHKLQEPDFEPVSARFKAAFAAGIPIHDEYALLWIRRGEGQSVKVDVARQSAAKALDLNPKNEEIRAEAYALSAAADLPGNLDEAGKRLAQAEALPREKLRSDTLNWLARLRGIFFLDQKNYQAAYEQAEKAQNIDPNSVSKLLSAQVAVYWADALQNADPQDRKAKELYTNARQLVQPLIRDRFADADYVYIKANHELGLDQESRQTLLAILEDDPQDISAAENLMFVCSEYAFDFDCSYSEAKKLVRLFKADPVLQANAAEAAVLTGDYQQASAWLDTLLTRADLDPTSKAVASFYKLWISLVRGQAGMKHDFDSVLRSLTVYTETQAQSPESKPSFQGARIALAKTGLSQEKQQLLTDIIAVLENPSKGTASIKPLQEM